MTTINMQDAKQREFFAAAQLKGQLKILNAGMTIRGLNKTTALQRASKIMGKTYKRTQIVAAIEDLHNHVEALITDKKGN